MRASVALLGYEWTHTRRREKQLAEALVHLSREQHACPRHGRTVTYDFFSLFSLFHFFLLFSLFSLFSFFHSLFLLSNFSLFLSFLTS